MTERQAWLELAGLISGGVNLCCGGLCCEIDSLKATKGVRARMAAIVDALPKPHDYGGVVYAWKLTPHGKRARIAFCKSRAARCARESRRRKRAEATV